MRVRFFDKESYASTAAELRDGLCARDGSLGCFWLGDWPQLAIMVRDESACVHYFPHSEHPGFYAAGPVQDWTSRIAFVADNYETTEVPVSMVIAWEAAIKAAEEFLQVQALPSSLRWEEL